MRSLEDPAELTVGGLRRLLDDVNEAIDPSALERAIRDGAVELVDFSAPMVDEEFYRGVDVVPGHVVAGLPVEREEVGTLRESLLINSVALVVGPSGCGKSALIWLAAHADRHRYCWYRIKRLSMADAPNLVRLVKSFKASQVPLAFVVDDLGRADREGFDWLVEELREYPAVKVVGACREEDLLLVETGSTATIVRPELTPALAETIWSELRAQG